MQETQETQVRSLDQKDLLQEEMATHSSILAWEIHGQRSLEGYTLWGLRELDMTEQLSMHDEVLMSATSHFLHQG